MCVLVASTAAVEAGGAPAVEAAGVVGAAAVHPVGAITSHLLATSRFAFGADKPGSVIRPLFGGRSGPGGVLSTPRSVFFAARGSNNACGMRDIGDCSSWPIIPFIDSLVPRDEYGMSLAGSGMREKTSGASAHTFIFEAAANTSADTAGHRLCAGGAARLRRFAIASRNKEVPAGHWRCEVENCIKDDTALTHAGAFCSSADADEVEDSPFKWLVRELELPVCCSVRCVDLEGLSDGRSLKAIVTQLTPRRAVFVRGDEASVASMSSYCVAHSPIASTAVSGSVGGRQSVFAPALGEAVDGSSHSSVFTVRLAEALLAPLATCTRNVGDYDVVRLSGALQLLLPNVVCHTMSGSASDCVVTARVDAPPLRIGLLGMLVPPRCDRPANAQLVAQGDVRLADLKVKLARAGKKAYFRAGALLIYEGLVRVKKDGGGKLVLEGEFGPGYIHVHALLCAQLASL
jgi:hypothetical protein